MRAILRAGLALLLAIESVLGLWTELAPRSFYDNFPTVNLDPPFNEHFVRDFGGATLGIVVVLAVATWTLERRIVVVALLALLAFAVPHLVFHADHLANFSVAEAEFVVIALAVVVALDLALLVCALRFLPKVEVKVRDTR